MKSIVVFWGLLFTGLSIDCLAADFFTLYGYKIGQPLNFAKQRLGEPDKVLPYPDGWKAHAYLRDGHNIIFETDNTRPDLIISIQIEGELNPPNMGVEGIDLGSDAKKVAEKLGTPTERKPADNASTNTPVPDTYINFYGNGFSFEEKNSKVSSIKVIFAGPAKSGDRPDFDAFLQNIKSKNYYRVAESISSEFTLNGKKIVNGPIVNEITEKTELNTFLFGKNGIGTLTSKDVADVNLRVAVGSTGFVYKFKDKQVHELYFVRSFEGWVLYDAW